MSRYERASRLVLPIGIVAALLLGLFLPRPGRWLESASAGPLDVAVASVVVIFLISGVAIHGAAVRRSGFLRTVAVVLAANLVIAPILAAVALRTLPLDGGLALGLAVTVSVPTTLSSAAVMTQVSGGDHVWGSALTVACVAVGAFTAPVAVALLLQQQAQVPALPLLARVAVLVIIPLLLGNVLARVTGWSVNRFWRLVPSLGVITLAWVTVSASSEGLRATPAARLAGTVVLVVAAHAVMLLLAYAASRALPPPQALAAFFVTAQKTLPLALTLVAAVVSLAPELRPVAGEAVVVAMLWHFTQLLADGTLAARWGARNAAAPPLRKPA